MRILTHNIGAFKRMEMVPLKNITGEKYSSTSVGCAKLRFLLSLVLGIKQTGTLDE